MNDGLKSLEDKIIKIRNDFPILSREINGNNLSYLDNAASSQKPNAVIDKMSSIYSNSYSNVHRGVHTLSMESTIAYEDVRKTVAGFINAPNHESIIYTKGTTDSINLFCQGWAKNNLKKGDKVVLSEVEHHANLVPWFMLRDAIGIVIEYIPVGEDFLLDMNVAEQVIDEQTKIVSISHISNSLGTIVPLKEIIEIAHKNDAIVLVDGAQSIPHQRIDVDVLDIDVLVFSAHKMCGPTGVGILWGKESILNQMEPISGGGDMISSVTFDNANWNEIPLIKELDTTNLNYKVVDNNNKEHFGGTAVNVGNPHVVFFVNNIEDFNLEKIGPEIENDKLFPEKCNVTLAKIINENHIKVKVWERGAGLTKACGTAACATAFAAKINGKIKNKTEIEFELGKLSIFIDENKNIYISRKNSYHGKKCN